MAYNGIWEGHLIAKPSSNYNSILCHHGTCKPPARRKTWVLPHELLSKLLVSPLNNPYSSPLYNPLYKAPLRSLDYGSYGAKAVAGLKMLVIVCRAKESNHPKP